MYFEYIWVSILPMNYRKLIWIMIILAGCDYAEETREKHYDHLFTHKLPIRKMAAEALKKAGAMPCLLSENTLIDGYFVGLLSPADNNDYDSDDFSFFIVNLKDTADTKLIRNPFGKVNRYSVNTSYADGKLYALDGRNEWLLSYNCTTGVLDSLDLRRFDLFYPGQFYVSDNKVFILDDVYGCLVFDLKGEKCVDARNNIGSVINYNFTVFAIPLAKDLNLASGERKVKSMLHDTLLLHTIDSSFAIRATYEIFGDLKRGIFKMMTFPDGYAIVNESELILLDKRTLREKWRRKLEGSIGHAFQLSTSALLVVTDSLTEDKKLLGHVHKIDVQTGSSKWTTPMERISQIGLGADNRLIAYREKKILLLDAANGKVLEKSTNYGEDVWFDVITDPVTGNNYYYAGHSILYW